MSERLPYEEQLARQLGDLPLPEENAAWADMKRRLDEDDNDSLVPFWLRGCAGWGLLLLVIAGLGWWALQPQKWFRSKTKTENVKQVDDKKITENSPNNKTIVIQPKDSIRTGRDTVDAESKIKTGSGKDNVDNSQSKIVVTPGTETKQKALISVQPGSRSKKGEKTKTTPVQDKKSKEQEKEREKVVDDASISVSSPPTTKISKPVDSVITNHAPIPEIKKTTDDKKSDTLHTTITDTVKKKVTEPKVKTTEQKKDSSKPKVFFWSAGLAVQQQIALDNQSRVPYNALGRKGTLADYIPSAYLRWNKKDKWFFQVEFKYGAPQYTPDLLYFQRIDTLINPTKIRTSSSTVIKTYYHQVPLTFNYFVLPGWSVGGGAIWNKFSSAVISKDVIDHNGQTGLDTIVSQGLIQRIRKPDSNFVKSYFQAVFESQYKWKRFSIGARYTFGLQPYVRFTLPGGTEQQEKNRSLQLFLRYELWKSKEKTKH